MADILAIVWLALLVPVWIFAALFASDDPNGSPIMTASSIVLILALPSLIYFARGIYANQGSQFKMRRSYLIALALVIAFVSFTIYKNS